MIATKLKRFLLAYTLALLSTVGLTVVLAFNLRPYFGELLNRWMGQTPACGCEQYAVLPMNSSSLLLFIGLAAVTLLLLAMIAKLAWSLFQTNRFRATLKRQQLSTTLYHGTQIHLVRQTEPLAVCVGYLRPAVYISTGLVQSLTGFELLAVIQHEVAHAKQLDPAQRLALMALPNWVPGWKAQLEHYLAGQEILADDMVTNTTAIQSAFVKLVDQLRFQPTVAATFFSTNQARIDHWLGESVPLPTLRLGLIAVTMWLLALLSSYRAFAAEPTAQAFGQCLAVQTMCESTMTYVVQ